MQTNRFLDLSTQKRPTPVDVNKLAKYLEGYDPDKTTKIIDGFTSGFRTGHSGPVICNLCDNLKSARDIPDMVETKN